LIFRILESKFKEAEYEEKENQQEVTLHERKMYGVKCIGLIKKNPETVLIFNRKNSLFKVINFSWTFWLL